MIDTKVLTHEALLFNNSNQNSNNDNLLRVFLAGF